MDQGDGRMARRELAQQMRCRASLRAQRLLETALQQCLDDESLLPLGAHRYPVNVHDWVERAHTMLCQHVTRPDANALSRSSPTVPSSEGSAEGPFGMMHAAHVWRDGTWSTAEDLMRMGRFDLLPRRPGAEETGHPDGRPGDCGGV